MKMGLIYRCLEFLLLPFTSRVKCLEGADRALREHLESGQVVFVAQMASFVDLLIVNRMLRRFKLSPLDFVHGISPFLWMPLGQAFRTFSRRLFLGNEAVGREEMEQVKRHVRDGKNGLVFLKRSRVFLGATHFYYRGFFGGMARDIAERESPVFFVPTSVFLTRKRRNTERNLWEIFFGTYDTPGKLRKAVQLLVFSGKGMVVFSKAIDVQREMDQPDNRDAEVEKLEKRFRWTLLFHLNMEDRAYRGPTKRSVERKVRKILKERRLKGELERIAERQNRNLEVVMREADKNLHEIASDTNERVISILKMVFDFVWARTLEGIDYLPNDLLRLRELCKQGPVVFLPSHRSHVDYLLFCWLFELQGINYPRLAAGENLNKWPLGSIFRRAGAFFIRRSFKGETIYPVVFEAYVRHLLRHGNVICFFMEGGRSRTGKLLHPKLGLLSMIVDAWKQGAVKDLPLVPVTIDYGKVFEGEAYVTEMSGGEKRREDFRALLSTPSFLRKKHGIIRIRFGEHISLRDYAQDHGITPETLSFKNRLPFLHELAFDVMRQVNQNVTLTAANVLAGILMSNPRRGMTLRQLKVYFTFLVRLLRRRGVELAFGEETLDLALKNALETFVQWETVVKVDVGGETVISIPKNQRSRMEYYKNNGLHFVLDLALVAMAFKTLDAPVTSDDIEARVRDMCDVLQLEFIFPRSFPNRSLVEDALKVFITGGALKQGEQGQWVCSDDKRYQFGLDLAANVLRNILESYLIVADGLENLESDVAINKKNLIKQLMSRGQLLYAVGTVRRFESVNKVTLANALERFAKVRLIKFRQSKNPKYPDVIPVSDHAEECAAMRQKLFRWTSSLD